MTQVIGLLGYEKLAALASALSFTPKRQRFIFVRHGETEGNRTRIFQVPHIPLNQAGEIQAAAAATTLAQTRIGRLVASPMARAWRTATLIGGQHNMLPEADGALAERYYVNLWDTPVPTGGLDWGEDPPGSETLAGFVSRVSHSLIRILSDDDVDGETVIVAHGGVLLVLCAATGVSLGDGLRRNAVPLQFKRANGAWAFTPL
ncbi:histidine phosphatase family protein [Terrarubrum flagellatum]|uniref:histidine phosphatase family protein n=1 Tax=Terrirubrum flagellatum TaxID=2895980 RepID=UPI00314517BA